MELTNRNRPVNVLDTNSKTYLGLSKLEKLAMELYCREVTGKNTFYDYKNQASLAIQKANIFFDELEKQK